MSSGRLVAGQTALAGLLAPQTTALNVDPSDSSWGSLVALLGRPIGAAEGALRPNEDVPAI